MRECPNCLRCFGDEVSRCPFEGQLTFNSLAGEVVLDGRYQLEQRLGQGGMGVVYKAHHVFLKSAHAVKVIMPDLVGNDPSLATRFRQEAMVAAAIRHPNIISVTDYGFIGGAIPFLVMEFVHGDSLQDVMIGEGKFSPEKALDYIRVIAAGVGAAHQQGVVHRDLKPLNIMIQRNRELRDGIKILDFGLAKIKSGELLGSFVGAKTTGIIGSPYYMAPEQWSDEEPDKRCDIYSLGVILHQMLTGDVPFKGSSIPAIMKKHLMTSPPPLANAKAGISKALERVVHHALEKDPKARIASAEDLIAELEQGVLEVDATAGKPTTRRRTAKPKADVSGAKDVVAVPVTEERKKTRRQPARITAEQKKAQPAEKEIARRTADHEEVWREAKEDKTRLQEETRVDFRLEEVTGKAEGAEALAKAEYDRRYVEAEEFEAREKAARRRVEKEDTKSQSGDEEAWRKAADEARRRAEERAMRESGPQSAGVLVTESVRPTPQSRRFPLRAGRFPLLAGLGGAAVLLLAIVGLATYFLWPSAKTPKTADGTGSSVDMVDVAGGMFMMGRDPFDGKYPNQYPAHAVTVTSFSIDRTEVTNFEYAGCVRSGKCHAPSSWNGAEPPVGEEKWPVANVSFHDANAFAAWRSERDGVKYRLPTEEEWEYAARGSDPQNIYPWGNTLANGYANVNSDSPKPVGLFANGKSPFGALDMIGNVWEWTSSKNSLYVGNDRAFALSPNETDYIIIRGGSYFEKGVGVEQVPATRRGAVEASSREKNVGFRLAR